MVQRQSQRQSQRYVSSAKSRRLNAPTRRTEFLTKMFERLTPAERFFKLFKGIVDETISFDVDGRLRVP